MTRRQKIDKASREGARATWSYRPCGTIGDYTRTLDYFLRVETARFDTYPWQKRIIDSLTSRSRERVLEIGPGQGTDLVQFAKKGSLCYAVDITEEHLDRTAANFDVRGLRPPLTIYGDATDLDLPERYFDVVLMHGVLHHIPEDELVMKQVERVLRDDGCLSLILYNRWSWFHLYKILDGIRSGGLRRLGYSAWMSTLEQGADGKVRKPFIRLYGQRDLRRLLKRWVWTSETYCMSPLPDWVPFGGWFHHILGWKR